MNLDTFTSCPVRLAYLECALWASVDDAGIPLDHLYHWSTTGLSEEDLSFIADRVKAFLSEPAVQPIIDSLDLDPGQVGHDLFLSGNGHGSGFWDRGHGQAGDTLHLAAVKHGSLDLYVGDDGKLHVF